MKGTYRVDENHAFVLQAQELSQVAHVAIKLLQKAVNFVLFNLDNETLWALDALRGDDEVAIAQVRTM